MRILNFLSVPNKIHRFKALFSILPRTKAFRFDRNVRNKYEKRKISELFFFADSLIRANKYGKRNKKQNPIISINQIFIENDNNKRNGKTRKSIIFVKI